MRYLNKIIFINSAHIPYAEIKLDGNVHFIGTQGVGKSTLLRAILFFYNVDKSKLGIRTQDKQKSYDEFYFPYPNSYIIYEICRENGTFFVMTFSSNGRVAFRIVDCPYEKRFFVEDDNNVRYEWGRISEQIGTKVFRSNIIRGYEEFRDIIYGNTQNVTKALRRFCLLESARYLNVPRTIQNIFLNQSLESRVIKDTIIDSMDFAGDGIDLNFYREHVKNFRQQYEDIWKWYKKEKNGKIKVCSDADNVINKYALYEATKGDIKLLCAKLNYALERDTEKLPQIQKYITEKGLELARLKKLLSDETYKYNNERDTLTGKEAVLNNFLKQVKSKQQHYNEIGITIIISKIAKEKELKIRKKGLEHQKELLTNKNQSVKTRYENIIQEVENNFREYSNQANIEINDIDRKIANAIVKLQDELQQQTDQLNVMYQQKIDEVQENIDAVKQEENELQLKKQKILQFNPFEQEMTDLTVQIRELENHEHRLSLNQKELQEEITKIINETESKRKDLENACEKDLAELDNIKNNIRKEINRLEELLSRQSGSLIEWLNKNFKGWEDNIGKVVDDEVLYSTHLEPQKSEDSDTIYGVHVALNNIDKKVNTPDEIIAQKTLLEKEISVIDNRYIKRKQQLEAEITELERIPNIRLRKLRIEKINLEAELKQIPARIKRCEKDLEEYNIRLKNWKEQELALIGEELNKLIAQKNQLLTSKQSVHTRKQKDVENLRKSYNKQKKEIEAEAQQKKNEIYSILERKKEEATAQKKELIAQMDAELKGLGVDTDKLAEIRNELEDISDELKYIDEHRPDYYAWLKDKEEYFDQETSKKEELKLLKQKLEDLEQKFRYRRQKKENEISVLENEIHTKQEEYSKLSEAIDRVNTFKLNTSCSVDITKAGAKETTDQLSAILDNLRDNISMLQQCMEEFKKAVNVFKNNFSTQNTFHFRTEFNTETDYTEFAAELYEFISNKKIEEYRVRTSNQYANIIKRIAREVGDLNQHNAEIKATINEINRDFRENNFAGVIKEIELRAVESSDRLMQQLLNIKNFDEEYGFDIGQLNLFSNEDTINRTNQKAVSLLMGLIDMMDAEQKRDCITLSDTFKLEFKVKENDNDTNWVEKLSNVGSDGTDILVKSMVNIMLINVFKRKISQRFGDFKLHCMMDEIGKLHPNNVEGILKFANVRNIYLINSSPTTYNAQIYKYTYSLSKDEKNNTVVKTLLTIV